eukprot:GDKI01038564.1.p1 GENE.GDKI01038564.1~~GDKI01038564.1.p1  ORF type:complete len:436 (+),score=129.02 GDKI01038564.1:69-1376(+)
MFNFRFVSRVSVAGASLFGFSFVPFTSNSSSSSTSHTSTADIPVDVYLRSPQQQGVTVGGVRYFYNSFAARHPTLNGDRFVCDPERNMFVLIDGCGRHGGRVADFISHNLLLFVRNNVFNFFTQTHTRIVQQQQQLGNTHTHTSSSSVVSGRNKNGVSEKNTHTGGGMDVAFEKQLWGHALVTSFFDTDRALFHIGNLPDSTHTSDTSDSPTLSEHTTHTSDTPSSVSALSFLNTVKDTVHKYMDKKHVHAFLCSGASACVCAFTPHGVVSANLGECQGLAGYRSEKTAAKKRQRLGDPTDIELSRIAETHDTRNEKEEQRVRKMHTPRTHTHHLFKICLLHIRAHTHTTTSTHTHTHTNQPLYTPPIPCIFFLSASLPQRMQRISSAEDANKPGMVGCQAAALTTSVCPSSALNSRPWRVCHTHNRLSSEPLAM